MVSRFTAYVMPAPDRFAIESPIEITENGKRLYFEGAETLAQVAFDKYTRNRDDLKERGRVIVTRLIGDVTADYAPLEV